MFTENYQMAGVENPDGREVIDRQNNEMLADFIKHRLYHMKSPIQRILVSPLADRAGYHIVFIYDVNYEGKSYKPSAQMIAEGDCDGNCIQCEGKEICWNGKERT